MKIIPIILSILIITQVQAQNKIDIIINKLKKNFKEETSRKGNKTLFFNKMENIIEIDDMQISFLRTSIKYQVISNEKPLLKNHVNFECITDDCIQYSTFNLKQDKSYLKVSGVSIPFKTKNACYEFINLLSELKEAILSK